MNLFHRKKLRSKKDFAVSRNMAYGEVNMESLRDVLEGEYEDPGRLARSGQCGRENYEPTGCPAPYKLPGSKSEAPEVYAHDSR